MGMCVTWLGRLLRSCLCHRSRIDFERFAWLRWRMWVLCWWDAPSRSTMSTEHTGLWIIDFAIHNTFVAGWWLRIAAALCLWLVEQVTLEFIQIIYFNFDYTWSYLSWPQEITFRILKNRVLNNHSLSSPISIIIIVFILRPDDVVAKITGDLVINRSRRALAQRDFSSARIWNFWPGSFAGEAVSLLGDISWCVDIS